MNKTVEEFFEHTANNRWGELLLVHCTPDVLKKYTEGNIPETLNKVLQMENWQDERSDEWANKGSSNDVFMLFKVYELWKSIKQNGLKSPVHVHAVAEDNWLNFHPSNNKIEVLCEFFPDMEIQALYHNYDFLHENFEDDAVNWYKDHMHYAVETAEEYLKLYGHLYDNVSPDKLELDFHWDKCKDILEERDYVSSKTKPRKRDWRYVDVLYFSGEPDFENAAFLTVSDRYHRVAMERDAIKLKDIISVDGDTVLFCGKKYDILKK